MTEILLNILHNGQESGTMRIDFETAFDAWGITNFKKFTALAKESDSKTGTNALVTAAETLLNKAVSWFKSNLSELFARNRKAYEAAKRCDFKELKTFAGMRNDATEIEKTLKFLDVASAEKFAEFAECKKEIENEIEPNTAGNAENIAELLKRKARTTKKNAAYIANMNPEAPDYKTPFVVYVGDRVEIPKTDKATGYVAYIRYDAKTRKFAATEETSGIMLTTGKTRTALINELSKCEFVERVAKALESPRTAKAIEEVTRFKRGERAEIAAECKEASRDGFGSVPPEVASWFETVYPKKEENTMKNNVVWYHRPEEAAADCIAWEEYEAPAEIEEAPEEEAPKPETLPAGCMAIETRHAGTPYTAAETAEPEPTEEPQAEPENQNPKPYKSEELHEIMKTAETHVKYTGRTVKKYNEDGYYISYGARFVEGAFYRVPENCKKSRAAEIVFRVDRNTGKSLTVTAWEKYNGEITETTHKNKKLNPGSKYFWLHVDPENGKTVNIYSIPDAEREKYIDFSYWECIDIGKLSRWTSGTLSVIDAEPITAADFEAFKNAEPAEEAPKPSGITVTTRAKEYDYTPKYYPVSEHLARLHKEAISFDDYKEGSQTAEYKQEVDSVYKLARNSGDPEKSLFLADVFAKRLARWFDDMNRNGASCPSVMIAGPANFPVRKKERQNARHDTLMHQYSKIMRLKDKIAHPHGVEIIRDEIGNEFENVLYFTAVINNEENRLQLIFDDKPEENIHTILKKNGFRWSGRFNAWQRQLTENAICAAWCVVDALDKIEEEEAENAAKIGA